MFLLQNPVTAIGLLPGFLHMVNDNQAINSGVC